MNYKLSYYEDEYIKIEINGEKISYTSKTPEANEKEKIDFSFVIFKYICSILNELNNELQPERSKREDSSEHCESCICDCECRVFDIDHRNDCPANKN